MGFWQTGALSFIPLHQHTPPPQTPLQLEEAEGLLRGLSAPWVTLPALGRERELVPALPELW